MGLNRVGSGDELVKVMSVYELEDSLVESNRRDDGSCRLRENGTMHVPRTTKNKLLIPRLLLLAARRRGDRLLCFPCYSRKRDGETGCCVLPLAFLETRRSGEVELEFFILVLALRGNDNRELVSAFDVLAPLLLLGRRRGWGMRRFEYGDGMARPA